MNELTIIDTVEVGQVQATMQKISQFQAVVQGALRENHDYGVIPGTGTKPTLLKPGAEKILMLMGLTSEYEVSERVQDYVNGFFAFTVKCVLSKGGMRVTEGLGHANTKEARYARRWLTEKKLPEGVDKKNLRKREKNGKYGKYVEYLVENDDPYTLANTVLKMAKKRAQVDAALTVASLSDIFTQDLEDLSLGKDKPSPSSAPLDSPPPEQGSGNQQGRSVKHQADATPKNQPEQKNQPRTDIPSDALVCHNCEAEITPGVKLYSERNFGRPLCNGCQSKEKGK